MLMIAHCEFNIGKNNKNLFVSSSFFYWQEPKQAIKCSAVETIFHVI